MNTIRRGLGVVVVATALLAAPAPARAADREMLRPDGAAPYPTVLFVSGCSGFAPGLSPKYYRTAAERFRAAGYLVVFVDYLTPRKLANCAAPPGVTHAAAAGDVMTALREVVDGGLARRDEITAIGWSYGGGILIAALEALPPASAAPFRAVLFYPDCRRRGPWRVPTDMLVLFGGKDTVAKPAHCDGALKTAAEPTRIRVQTYPDGLHAFDIEELPPRVEYPFGTIGYDPASGAAAWAEVRTFMKNERLK